MKSLFTIVGVKYRGHAAEDAVKALRAGDQVVLKRDENNRHDFNAVQVWVGELHVGYIKGTENTPLARYMDHHDKKTLLAHYVVTPDRWPQIELEIEWR